jgi:hypothetical protein
MQKKIDYCLDDEHRFEKRTVCELIPVKNLSEWNDIPPTVEMKIDVVCKTCGLPKEIFEDKRQYFIWKADRRASLHVARWIYTHLG